LHPLITILFCSRKSCMEYCGIDGSSSTTTASESGVNGRLGTRSATKGTWRSTKARLGRQQARNLHRPMATRTNLCMYPRSGNLLGATPKWTGRIHNRYRRKGRARHELLFLLLVRAAFLSRSLFKSLPPESI
jgi:hypothetical protein